MISRARQSFFRILGNFLLNSVTRSSIQSCLSLFGENACRCTSHHDRNSRNRDARASLSRGFMHRVTPPGSPDYSPHNRTMNYGSMLSPPRPLFAFPRASNVQNPPELARFIHHSHPPPSPRNPFFTRSLISTVSNRFSLLYFIVCEHRLYGLFLFLFSPFFFSFLLDRFLLLLLFLVNFIFFVILCVVIFLSFRFSLFIFVRLYVSFEFFFNFLPFY